MNELVIIGASGHGKVVADIACQLGYTQIVFLDDNPDAKQCGVFPVVGSSDDIERFPSADFVVAIGNAKARRRIQKNLYRVGLHVVSLIHPAAVVASHVEIGCGTVVMAGAVINPYVTIGEGCIINTCASLDHDCVVGEYSHISIGSHVAGTVNIGANTWIGAGSTISNNINITADCIIGAGSVVIRNISEADTYIGVPARKLTRTH